MHPSIQKLVEIVLPAGMQTSPEMIRSQLSADATRISSTLDEIVEIGMSRIPPAELLAMLDFAKGLIFRNMVGVRRLRGAGQATPSAFVHVPKPHLIEQYLRAAGNTALCYFYKSMCGEVSAFVAQNFGAHRPIGFAQLRIVTGGDASRFNEALTKYAASLTTGEPDMELQDEVLRPFGRMLLPFFVAHASAPRTLSSPA